MVNSELFTIQLGICTFIIARNKINQYVILLNIVGLHEWPTLVTVFRPPKVVKNQLSIAILLLFFIAHTQWPLVYKRSYNIATTPKCNTGHTINNIYTYYYKKVMFVFL